MCSTGERKLGVSMKKTLGKRILNNTYSLPLAVLLIIVIIALVSFITSREFDTTLEFSARDAVSKDFIWDAEFVLKDRLIRAFYQSDRGTRTYTFTNLEPGESELVLKAPSYETVTYSITLKRGKNVNDEPVELMGYEIPNLDYFYVFEEYQGRDLLMELHPVGTDGTAVTNHPCVNIRIGAVVYEQIIDGKPVTKETKTGSQRGRELFMGLIPWEYDALPETIFRYTGRLKAQRLADSQAPYWVIDYLIIVPDSRKISAEEVDTLIEQGAAAGDMEEFAALLDKEEERLDYFYFTNWNVERPR